MESFLLRANVHQFFPQNIIKAELLISSKALFHKKLIKRIKTYIILSTMYAAVRMY